MHSDDVEPGFLEPEWSAFSRVSVMQRPPHVADRRPPGRSRHPARADAPVGAVAADPAARAAGRSARAGHASAAGGRYTDTILHGRHSAFKMGSLNAYGERENPRFYRTESSLVQKRPL